MTTLTGSRLVFPERGVVALEEFDLPDVGPAQVLLRTRYSLMSSGTERIVLHGRFDQGTHWEGYARYPFHPGYSAVGEVVTVGAEVVEVAVGDLVAAAVGHASHHVTNALGCTRVPDGVDPQQATWFALAKVAADGCAGRGLRARRERAHHRRRPARADDDPMGQRGGAGATWWSSRSRHAARWPDVAARPRRSPPTSPIAPRSSPRATAGNRST